MGQVFVAGALHLDVVITAPRLPQTDETVTGNKVDYLLGGKGANQAVAAARMGAKVAMAGCVGDDAFAGRLLVGLDEAGVDRTQVATVPGASGMSAAIVDVHGDYAATIVSAANLKFDANKVQIPANTELLMLQNEIPEAANLALARKASKLGITVMLNAAPAHNIASELPELADILLVNQLEANQLTDKQDPEESAAELAKLGCGAAIVTMGANGLVLCDTSDTRAMPAFEASVRSTHGAGDMFAGALAAELVRGSDLAAACGFAQAAAALHVSAGVAERASLSADKAKALLTAKKRTGR